METAKQIADKYFPHDFVENFNLESDILRYLEHYAKKWGTGVTVIECDHFWTRDSGITSAVEHCMKCGITKPHFSTTTTY